MSSNPTWSQFQTYWDSQGGKHQAITGLVGGAIGGFIAALIVGVTIWLCLRQNKRQIQRPVHTTN